VHKEFRRADGRHATVLAPWRLRALQVGVTVFTALLLTSLVGLVLR
jgi:hypothetical protein